MNGDLFEIQRQDESRDIIVRFADSSFTKHFFFLFILVIIRKNNINSWIQTTVKINSIIFLIACRKFYLDCNIFVCKKVIHEVMKNFMPISIKGKAIGFFV